MAMSDTLKLLRDLGGHATMREMKIAARKAYPDYTFAEYISRDLKKLQLAHKVTYNESTNLWYLVT
jgi:hypothetical protein